MKKNLLCFIGILFVLVATPVIAVEIYKQVDQTGDSTPADNWGITGTLYAFINNTFITDSASIIVFNISCSSSGAGQSMQTPSFCERFEDNEYSHDCINSTRVNVTKGGLTTWSCPIGSGYALSDNITMDIDPSKNYIFQRYVTTPNDYYVRYTNANTQILGGYSTTSNAQTNPDGATFNNKNTNLNDVWAILSTPPPDSIPPLVEWLNQTPADIQGFNVVNNNLSIWFNITDETELDDSTVVLSHITNDTHNPRLIFFNGTAVDGISKHAKTSNSSSAYFFELFDTDVYGGIYTLDSDLVEDEPHLVETLSSAGNGLKMEFFNINPNINTTTLEIMVNVSSGSGELQFHYCNSSYSTGNYESSNNCAVFFNLDSTAQFNHSESAFSAHHTIPMFIFDKNISGVKVTNRSFIIVDPAIGATSWDVHYVPNITRANTTETTNNNGIGWSTLSGTVDAHIHQLNGTEVFNYYVCANDTAGNENCSSLITDSIGLPILPPISPVILNPDAELFNSIIIINYTKSVGTQSIDHYNISIYDNAGVWVSAIVSNNGLNLNYSWDSSSVADGNYTIHVTAIDTLGLSSVGISEEFEIDNTNPTLNIYTPTSAQTFMNDSAIFNFECSDDNLFGYDFHVFNTTDYIVQQSLRNLTQTIIQYNNTMNFTNMSDGVYTITVNCLDGHTANEIKDKVVTTTLRSIAIDEFIITIDEDSLITWKKEKDKITFDFETPTLTMHTITVTSNSIIYLREKGLYSAYGHFIAGNNWLDFKPYFFDDVRRISDYHYEIDFYGDKFKFKSLGDLNNQSITRTFTIAREIDAGVTWETYDPLNDTTLTNETSINFQFNYSNSNNTNAVCTLWRSDNNVTSLDISPQIINFTDTRPSTYNATDRYWVFCNAYENGLSLNSTVKFITFDNTPLVLPERTQVQVLDDFLRILFIMFMFGIHFVLVGLGFAKRVRILIVFGGVLGVLASLVALVHISMISTFGKLAGLFFSSYTLFSTGLLIVIMWRKLFDEEDNQKEER